MAQKRKNDEASPVIADAVITTDDGQTSLRIIFNIQDIYTDRDVYEDELRYARNIPFDLESVQATDPIALVAAAERPSLVKKKSTGAIEYARKYYEKHLEIIQREAIMLCSINSPENDELLDVEAPPYKQVEEERKLAGILYLPEPERDLDNPVEARLRNFYDVLERNPELAPQFYAVFNRGMAHLAVEAKRRGKEESGKVDKAGFQPEPVDGDVRS